MMKFANRRSWLFIVCVAIILGGCASRGKSLADIKDVSVPKVVHIIQPGAEIPSWASVFTGSWYGKWHENRPHVLIIKNIVSTKEVHADYYLGSGVENKKPYYEDVTGGFKERILTFTLKSGSVVGYRMNAVGNLEAKHQMPNTDVFSDAIMEKLRE